MKKFCIVLAVLALITMLTGCGKKWTYDYCGKTWRGKAYYTVFDGPDSTLCEDCAKAYYIGFPYQNWEKK